MGSMICRRLSITLFSVSVFLLGIAPSNADETCMSPYMAKIVGQEDFAYVWTRQVAHFILGEKWCPDLIFETDFTAIVK